MYTFKKLEEACAIDDLESLKEQFSFVPFNPIHTRMFKKIFYPFSASKIFLLKEPKTAYPTAIFLVIASKFSPFNKYSVTQEISNLFYIACISGSTNILEYFITDKKFQSYCDPTTEAENFLYYSWREGWNFNEKIKSSAEFLIFHHDTLLPKQIIKSKSQLAVAFQNIFKEKENIVSSYKKLEKELSNTQNTTIKKHKI